jgi:hypothetical protein
MSRLPFNQHKVPKGAENSQKIATSHDIWCILFKICKGDILHLVIGTYFRRYLFLGEAFWLWGANAPFILNTI